VCRLALEDSEKNAWQIYEKLDMYIISKRKKDMLLLIIGGIPHSTLEVTARLAFTDGDETDPFLWPLFCCLATSDWAKTIYDMRCGIETRPGDGLCIGHQE
jgi:hypothetical protein